MKLPIRNHPAADAELLEAARWYETREVGLGDLFVEAFERTRERIEATPGACSPVPGASGTRRARMRRPFPFDVIFEERVDGLVILAIAHDSRDPGYWHGRRP